MDTLQILRILEDTDKNIFTTQDLKKILEVQNTNTLYKTVERLIRKNILVRITKGIYFVSTKTPDEFEIATFLKRPSYVSLESALNFYGILIQSPYQIISVTPKRGGKIIFKDKEFLFYHILPEYFWGYKKMNNFLIAEPEKAIIDEIYFESKGRETIDFKECDLSSINRKKLKEYAKKVDWLPFHKLFRKIFYDY